MPKLQDLYKKLLKLARENLIKLCLDNFIYNHKANPAPFRLYAYFNSLMSRSLKSNYKFLSHHLHNLASLPTNRNIMTINFLASQDKI